MKCILTVLLLCFCISYNSIIFSIFLCLESSFFIWIELEYDWREVWKRIRVPLPFILLSVLPILLEISFRPVSYQWGWHIGNLYFFTDMTHFKEGIQLLFKVLACMSILHFLLVTTPIHKIGGVFYRMKAPVILINIFYLTYRFIFLIKKTYLELYYSVVARHGFDSFIMSCKSFSMIVSQLFIKTFEKSRIYMQAMDGRGYEGELMIYIEEEELSFKEYVVSGGILLSVAIVVFVDYWLKR